MYIKRTIRKAIATMNVENNQLCTQSKSEYIFKVDGLDLEKDMFNGFYLNGSWVFNGLDNNLYLLKDRGVLEKVIEGKAIASLDRNEGILLLSYDSNGSGYKRSLFDLKSLIELTEKPDWIEMWQIILRKTTVFYTYSKTDIACMNLIDNSYLWQLSLLELLTSQLIKGNGWEINHLIGLVGEVLWLDIASRGVGGALLGLDVNNGQVVHSLDKTIAMEGSEDGYLLLFKNRLPSQLYSNYDEKRKMIFGFNEYLYWEVDITAEDPIIYTRSLRAVLEPLKATLPPSPEYCGITDAYIFASTGGLGEILLSQVYALNRQTFQVDWQYTFDEPSPYFPIKADVSDTHLFVLDSGGTLHIFEKEEIV